MHVLRSVPMRTYGNAELEQAVMAYEGAYAAFEAADPASPLAVDESILLLGAAELRLRLVLEHHRRQLGTAS